MPFEPTRPPTTPDGDPTDSYRVCDCHITDRCAGCGGCTVCDRCYCAELA